MAYSASTLNFEMLSPVKGVSMTFEFLDFKKLYGP